MSSVASSVMVSGVSGVSDVSVVSGVGVSGLMLRNLDVLCRDYARDVLKSLSALRGFDLDVLLDGFVWPSLCLSSSSKKVGKVVKDKVSDKVVKSRSTSNKLDVDLPSVLLPFLGVLPVCCKGVIRNHNLYTQCTRLPKVGDLCKKCDGMKAGDKFLGLITSRVVGEMDFNTGTKVVKIGNYADICNKLGISKDVAQSEASRFGWTLSDDYFLEKEKIRGRPKKSCDDVVKKLDGDKKRGRPKKDKKTVSDVSGDDLIAKLVAEVSDKEDKCSVSSSSSDTNDAEVIPANVPKVVAVSVVKDKKKKESKNESKKSSKVVTKPPTPPPMESLSSESESEEEEEEAKVVTVKKFEFEGKRYKLSSENILYDWDTDEPVGTWNGDKKCIEEYEVSSEEDSDDE